MARKVTEEKINLDSILFKCRDILRQARNSGSFFEKRDMMEEIAAHGWSLVPSKYIEFIDHDLEIDFHAEMTRIQGEMREILAQERQSQKMLEEAFGGIGYGID